MYKEDTLNQLAANIPGGLATLEMSEDGEIRILYANEGFYQLTGYTEKEWKEQYGEYAGQMIHDEDFDVLVRAFQNAKGRMEVIRTEFRAKHRNGRTVWLALQGSKVSLPDTEKSAFGESVDKLVINVSILDITRQKRAEEKLYIQNKQYLIVEEICHDIICEYDLETDTLVFPKRLALKLGSNRKRTNFIKGLGRNATIHDEDKDVIQENFDKLYHSDETCEFEFRTKLFTNEYRWFGGVFARVCDESRKPVQYVGKLLDIDEEKRQLIQLMESTKLDPMTGLLNKVAIQNDVTAILGSSAKDVQHALMIVDVDNFKKVNDSMGHAFGDVIIKSIAEQMKLCVGDKGIIGRVGGDEFLIFLCCQSMEEISALAERLTAIFYDIYTGTENLSVSGSTGIALFPKDGETYEELFAKADAAMYTVKNNGKNSVAYYKEEQGPEHWLEMREDRKDDYQFKSLRITYRPGRYDTELMGFAFHVLSSAKNLSSALNLVLDRIGKQFSLSRIQVLKADRVNRAMEVLYLWKDKVIVLDAQPWMRSHFRSWEVMTGQFDENGMLVYSDVTKLSDPDMHRSVNEQGTKAFVNCGMYSDKGEFLGCIEFDDCCSTRNWKVIEKDTFFQFTSMVTHFIITHDHRQRDAKIIEKMSNYDKITGLYQYSQFKTELTRIMKKQGTMGKLALLSSDIGNFKFINDTYGMEVGDDVLKSFSEFFMIQNVDCIAGCRVYADNFYSLIRVNEREPLEERVFLMNEQFVREQNKKYPGMHFAIHSGIYYLEREDKDSIIVMDGATLAKKITKETQEINVAVFTDEMRENAIRESRVLAMIKGAIANRDVVPYLQPKVNLKTGEIVGAEALVRWKKNNQVYFYPNDFIHVLEKSGDIVELDFSVFEQILQKQREWIDKGKKAIPISVNISRIHCKFAECERKMVQLADKYKIPHNMIEIEITENAFLGDSNTLLKKLNYLKEAGFVISVDDFGSGYSSLGMISSMPIDVIKMDQSFLKRGIDSKRLSYVIEAMISMAHKMHLQVVCEGVETQEHIDFLLKCGCLHGQGYFFERPMPIDVFEEKYMG